MWLRGPCSRRVIYTVRGIVMGVLTARLGPALGSPRCGAQATKSRWYIHTLQLAQAASKQGTQSQAMLQIPGDCSFTSVDPLPSSAL